MGMSLKEKFELCQAYGETLETIGKAIGKGGGTVSGVINGKYASSKAELYETAIEAYLDRVLAANAPKKEPNAPKSEVWLSTAQEKIRDRIFKMNGSNLSFFELILGESGMGKTFLLEMTARELGGVYVKARKSLSASAFMSLLLRAIGEKPSGNTDDKFEAFCEAITQSKTRLIIVDEADLFVKDNDLTFERKFELLREIYEYGKRNNLGIAVIAVGLGVLKKRIDNLGGYLQSRLTYSPEMVLSRDELIKIGQMNGIDGEIAEFLAEGDNARLYEKTSLNLALGYEAKVAANLVYQTRRA
nr:MAG TPA: ATPase [Caudoviricetes sp.]